MLLKQIQYFMTVAKCRHFTRAAERLFVSQSALSQQVTKLEADLGVQLINRESHPIELTLAGEEFMHYASQVLNSLDTLEQQMQKYRPEHKHTLHLGMITGLGRLPLTDFLSAFNTSHENILFSLTNGLSKDLCHHLIEGKLDLAIFAAPCDVDSYGFDWISIQKEDFVAIVPAGHCLATKKQLDLADTVDEPFIFPTKDNVSHDLFLTACKAAGFSPKILIYCNEPGRRIELVKAGLGISMVSESGLRYYGYDDQLIVLPLSRPFYKHIIIARRKEPHTFPPLELFWAYMQDYLQHHLPRHENTGIIK